MEAKHLRDFRKYNPPTFNGSLKNPTKAELWLSSVETIFQYIKCLEDQKLQCEVFLLVENVKYWWRSTERMIYASGGQATWDQLKGRSYEKYFSNYVRYDKEVEFMNLKQGVMTVEEYEEELDKLSCFTLTWDPQRQKRSKELFKDYGMGVRHCKSS